MPFEFTILDALQALRCPVLDALAVFFDAAGAHGELWIAFTAVLLAFRRTRKAGLAMALALCLYMVSGHFILPALRHPARDAHPRGPAARLVLPLRAHGVGLCGSICPVVPKPQARGACAGFGGVHRLHPAVPLRPLPH